MNKNINIDELISLSQYAQVLRLLSDNDFTNTSLITNVINDNSKRVKSIICKLVKFGIVENSVLKPNEEEYLRKFKGYNEYNINIMKVFRVTKEAKKLIKQKIKLILRKTSNRLKDWLRVFNARKHKIDKENEQKSKNKEFLLSLDFKKVLRMSGFFGDLSFFGISNAYEWFCLTNREIAKRTCLTKFTIEKISENLYVN